MLSRVALALALAALPLAAAAQAYRCLGKDGRKHYGQTLPPQCAGLPVEQLNAQGMVVRRIDPQDEAARRARQQAEDAQWQREDAARLAQARRDRALLATYANEAEIELARKRALQEIEAAPLEPAERARRIAEANARFDADLIRFRELTGAAPPSRPAPLRAQKGVHVITPPPAAQPRWRDEQEARERADRERMRLLELESRRGPARPPAEEQWRRDAGPPQQRHETRDRDWDAQDLRAQEWLERRRERERRRAEAEERRSRESAPGLRTPGRQSEERRSGDAPFARPGGRGRFGDSRD